MVAVVDNVAVTKLAAAVSVGVLVVMVPGHI